MVLAVIFCFAYLEVKDIKYRILSTDSDSAHTNYVKISRRKNIDINAEQSSMFHISIQVKIVLESNIFAFLFLRLKGSHI